jgi:hypothetical protein
MVLPRLAVVSLLVALAACGSGSTEKQVDELESRCLALPGTSGTYAAAAKIFGPARTTVRCDPQTAQLPSDACQPTDGNLECQVFFEVQTPDYCGVHGCCQLCEVRLLQASTSQDLGGAPICAARFYRKQPCQ